jgi:hypothetical protein
MRRNEKKPARPADRLPRRSSLPQPGKPPVEEALPGRLLVLMSQLHRREEAPSGGPRP